MLGKRDNDLNSSGCAVKLGLSNLDQCYCVLMRIEQGCGRTVAQIKVNRSDSVIEKE